MRFNRLRLNGFKSFVDPTDMLIREGLTGVVGPNGCGKSNLLEALRWVMGENRPTAMRGAGMEDVIFAGTSSRGARNFAEVALVIDNADRLAPAGFNDQDQIEIIRRITRDAGSAYKVNTRDVRAKDVQMLFADASTGAHSPALVRQGQISELINAKPRARRRILEEAAGISGLYARRHDAELRLTATEANLTRVADVVEGLAGQLQVLARQAKQAQRYREIGEALRRAEGALLWRRWNEADHARQEAEAGLRAAAQAAATAEREAGAAATAREGAEAALAPARDEDAIASALFARLEAEGVTLADREGRALAAIDALRQRLDQLSRDAAREEALTRDATDSLERLEAEAEVLAAAADGQDDALEEAVEASEIAAERLADEELAHTARTEDVARLSARDQSARRLLADTRAALERTEAAAVRAGAEADTAAADQAGLADALTKAEDMLAEAREAAEAAEEALATAEDTRATAQEAEAEARAARSAAASEAGALAAEVAALTRLIDRDTEGGQPLLDRLRVAEGYEAALGAALADDLRAEEGPSGWIALPDYDAPDVPDGAVPLSDHVTAPPVLTRRLGRIGIVPRDAGAARQAALRPGQRLVSLEGDLWRWDGFRVGGDEAPSAAALRLRQKNRLAHLTEELEGAEARSTAAHTAHAAADSALIRATQDDQTAREMRRAADARVAEASRAASRAEADRSIAAGRVETARATARRHADESRAARLRLTEAEGQQVPEGDLAAARAAVEQGRMAVEGARIAMLSRRAALDDLRREGEARRRRRDEVARELAGWRQRSDTAGRRKAELADRHAATAQELEEATAAPEELAELREGLAERLEEAGARRNAARAALTAAETTARTAQEAERDTARHAADAREARARTEALRDAARDATDAAALRIAEETDRSPEALLATLGDPAAFGPAAQLEDDVARLRRQRDALGAVNLRAEEDARALTEEHDTLAAEKADLEEAIKALRAGIGGLNREGRERLLAAFTEVNASFGTLFTHLFGGGEARLVMVESDDPLDAGLEIMCQPPGKKLSTLSLLSGGEQTLTAMALIFAVFLANPAPICVLDEVDAPLDDANVTRFCDLLDEMTRRTDTRFLIITHHAVTMARMDRLFGVTMVEQGVSQLVSVDLKKAEALVA
ncbi:chromosome segregation SMC family protein [Falsirhodobacter halotolerans]|uniref:chromosome segregation SMC family protein n=1 Tax=Falsirhodobacter halotolerans TaxID=1146892 RepID=UPI001FD41629|nr:AAA family ATPase [Falsirhodobacter halotolerans]MCJ8138465.1 AAA family ATPase [Falsirhodobacter halotolerans]